MCMCGKKQHARIMICHSTQALKVSKDFGPLFKCAVVANLEAVGMQYIHLIWSTWTPRYFLLLIKSCHIPRPTTIHGSPSRGFYEPRLFYLTRDGSSCPAYVGYTASCNAVYLKICLDCFFHFLARGGMASPWRWSADEKVWAGFA